MIVRSRRSFSFVIDVDHGRGDRLAVEIGVGEQPGGRGEVEDVEEELAVVVPDRVPRPIICLNSTIELTTRAKTMFLQVGASTPVVSSWDVVRMTGDAVSTSWKLLRCRCRCRPSSAVTRQT